MATYTRYNSSIKRKTGICIDCPPEKGEQPIIAGRCNYHYALALKLKSRDKILERDAEKKEDLEIWYNQRAAQILMKPYDWEDGTWIAPQDYRSSTAHIIAKSKYPSVATHPMNWLLLSPRTGAHSRYDSSFDAAQQMNVWQEAVRRFKIFAHLIAKEELKNLPDILRKEIE